MKSGVFVSRAAAVFDHLRIFEDNGHRLGLLDGDLGRATLKHGVQADALARRGDEILDLEVVNVVVLCVVEGGRNGLEAWDVIVAARLQTFLG